MNKLTNIYILLIVFTDKLTVFHGSVFTWQVILMIRLVYDCNHIMILATVQSTILCYGEFRETENNANSLWIMLFLFYQFLLPEMYTNTY